MQPLPISINRLNAIAPYPVWQERKKINFQTDYDVLIGIEFVRDEEVFPSSSIYWFNIANLNDKPSPRDPKVMLTIFAIIEEFFRVNPGVLLYICDTMSNQQAMRARLFKHWFDAYSGSRNYVMRQEEIMDEDVLNYVAMIVQRSNPKIAEIISEFDAQVKLLKEKPGQNNNQ